MKLKLGYHSVPPGGWRWTDPDTGQIITASTFYDLVKSAERHREDNGLARFGNLDAVVEHNLCVELTEAGHGSWCIDRIRTITGGGSDLPAAHGRPVMDLETVKRGTGAVLTMINRAVRGESPFVPQAQADRRARVCKGCPKNVDAQGCWGCKGIMKTVTRTIGRRKTSYDSKLRACQVCKCVIASMVHVKLDILLRDMPEGEQDRYPSFCWKITEQEQEETARARRTRQD